VSTTWPDVAKTVVVCSAFVAAVHAVPSQSRVALVTALVEHFARHSIAAS